MTGRYAATRERLAPLSPRLFLAAGLLLSLFALNDLLRVLTATSWDRWSLVLLAAPGLLAGLLGLVGLGPTERAREHLLGRSGTALSGLGALAALGMLVFHAAALVVDAVATLAFVATHGTLVATTLASFAVGTGTLLSDPERRTLGVLLLLPGVATGLVVGSLLAGLSGEWLFLAYDALLGAGFLAVGLALRPDVPRSLLDALVPGEAA